MSQRSAIRRVVEPFEKPTIRGETKFSRRVEVERLRQSEDLRKTLDMQDATGGLATETISLWKKLPVENTRGEPGILY